ncbi:MAG: hypothetical protein R3F56_23820 [Planctomycetota bacterium]
MRGRDPSSWPGTVALLVAVALAYANALQAGLCLDAPAIITRDARIQVWEWPRLRDILFGDYWGLLRASGQYRPLTTLTYAVDYAVLGHGHRAAGYVLFNVVAHALAALSLRSVLQCIGVGRGAALAAALLWAVHPLGSEAVTNVVGRADVLACLGVLLGLRLHAGGGDGRFALWRRGAIAAAALLALGAKESGVVLVGLLFLHDLVCGGTTRTGGARWWRNRVVDAYAPCIVAVAVWGLMRGLALGHVDAVPAVDNPLMLLGPISSRLAATAVLLRTAALVVWPLGLSADRSWNALPVTEGSYAAAGVAAAAFLSACVVLAWRRRRRHALPAFLALAWFVTVAPVANVFLRIGTIYGERLHYLPSAWLVSLVVSAAGRRLRDRGRSARPWLVPAAVGALAVVLAVATHARNRAWHTPLALFAATVEAAPESFKAHNSYAVELYGDAVRRDAVAAHIDTILLHAERAKAIVSSLPDEHWPADVLANLAAFYRVKASLSAAAEATTWRHKAQAEYEGALRREAAVARGGAGGNWRLRKGLADVLRESSAVDAALAAYEAAAKLAPGPEVLLDYAATLRAAGQPRQALVAAVRVVLLDPANERAWQEVEQSAPLAGHAALVQRLADGSPRFDAAQPGARALLEASARAQHEAVLHLGQARAAEGFRQSVRAALGIDIGG